MQLLVLGASGLLGAEVALRAGFDEVRVAGTYLTAPRHDVAADWHQLDLRDRARVHALVQEIRPDIVIDAAYRQGDWSSTADGAANAALAAAAAGARLVFVSSDAVFSGDDSPYAETAPPDPITAYGAAKAAAETAVRAITPTAVVARTSLIITDTGASVHEQRALAAATGHGGALFTDDLRCPVHVSDLAAALLELAGADRAGVHHLAGFDAISRYDLGRLIAAREGLDPERIAPARRAEQHRPGPLNVRLDCTATAAHLRTRLRGAREFLQTRQ